MEMIDRLVDTQREDLKQTFDKKHADIIKQTQIMKVTLAHCRSKGWLDHAEIWNIIIYINIASHDLSVLVSQLHLERDVWARKQIGRHLVLALYETAEDMTQLLGRRIKNSLNSLNLLSIFEEDLRTVRRPLNEFWTENQEKFKEIRIVSAAHRDLDGLTLINTIEAINLMDIAELSLKFGRILNNIAEFMQAVLVEASKNVPEEN